MPENELTKIVELKKVEQKSKTIEEFVQEFRRVVKESKYKKQALIEEFKRKKVMNLDKHLRESK